MDDHQIRQQCHNLLPALTQVLDIVASKLADLPSSDFVLETAIKPIDSIKKKVNERELDNIADLSDLVRGRLFFSDNYDMKDVVSMVKKLLHDHIEDVDEKHSKDNGLKYEGITHIDLKINGINFELQIVPIEFKDDIEILHSIYGLFKNHQTRSKKQKKQLAKIHNHIIEYLENKSKENRQED